MDGSDSPMNFYGNLKAAVLKKMPKFSSRYVPAPAATIIRAAMQDLMLPQAEDGMISPSKISRPVDRHSYNFVWALNGSR